MYFKELCAEQNYPSLYEGALEAGRIIVLMGTCVPPRRNNTPLSPLPRKDTNHLSCSVLCFYKMSSNQRETAISFLTSQRGFKTKTHKNKMGFNETRCNNIDRQKQICNFKHTEEKQNSLPGEKTK
jgi:hypothetical protein